MRQVSNKRARLNRAVKPARDDYRAMFPLCQWCLEPASELHEISRGAGRGSSLSVRAAWLHLCVDCHREMGMFPVAGQLAIKQSVDPDGYDRVAVNRLRGRADNAITESEVEVWVRRLRVSDRHWSQTGARGHGAEHKGMKPPLDVART